MDMGANMMMSAINEGTLSTKSSSWLVEGIGEDFIPDIANFSRVTKAYPISDAESFAAARELLRKEGLLAGSSSGTLLSAALEYCREQTEPKRVVTFACDTGNKYLSKLYNDFWMEDQGFIEREQQGDLTDLIGRPRAQDLTAGSHSRGLRSGSRSYLRFPPTATRSADSAAKSNVTGAVASRVGENSK